LSWLDKTKNKFEVFFYIVFTMVCTHVVGSPKAVYHIQHTMVSLSPFQWFIYFCDKFFLPFCKKKKLKKNVFNQNFPVFLFNLKKSPKITTISYNMNERVPNIFYFHILNITKFDSIYYSKWLPLEQHQQNWKKNIFLGPKFKPSFALFGCCNTSSKNIPYMVMLLPLVLRLEMLFELAAL
jgi:hypothetical protein